MVTLKLSMTATGKLLTQDQAPALAKVMGDIIGELIQKGESLLDERLRPRPAGVYLSVGQAQRGHASTGHFRRSVNSRRSQRNGIIQSNVVYGPWLEGDSARNATSRFKGYQSFRKVGQELEKGAGVVITRHANRFIRSLG